jgi:choline dehydrogenase-like flavoprotein
MLGGCTLPCSFLESMMTLCYSYLNRHCFECYDVRYSAHTIPRYHSHPHPFSLRFHRGAPSDYDEWAQTGLDGAERWSFKNLLPYVIGRPSRISLDVICLVIFINSRSSYPAHAIRKSTLLRGYAFFPLHCWHDFSRTRSCGKGLNGPVTVGYFGYIHTVCAKWMQSCLNLGIPFNPDVNNAEAGTLGVTKVCDFTVVPVEPWLIHT